MSISRDSCTSRILTGLAPLSLCKGGWFLQRSLLPHALQWVPQNSSFGHHPAKGDATAALCRGAQSAALTQQIFTI